ncbi:MAG TPA: glycosyltransferase [Acidimicrobiales bacterium]|nr:glycosyltransferase [Acidimicrobiales bacterium]
MEPSAGSPRPAASIVIPLWNNVAYTHACLVRLAEATPAGTFEVVLVDNGSTDGTAELLAALSGDVRIVRNAQNLGFSRACNQGAEVATGRHLVFLNNDTEPHPGWLQPLVEVLDGEPDVGVVGSKLLFPNGLVQHAGVWMVGDGSRKYLHGYHRLYLAVPDDPAVEERCDLQVVTGAALAIRSDLFRQLGGFDEGYWNGNEDVDLCLKVREAGYRVVYEPRSCLTHHESVSGPERFSRTSDNVVRLSQRWSAQTALDGIGDCGVFRSGSGVGAPARTGIADASLPVARTARSSRLRPDAVHVVGHMGPGGGPGWTASMAADLLSAGGIEHDVSAFHLAWTYDSPPGYSLNGTGDSCGIVLICAEPQLLPWILADRGARFLEHRYVVALWGWPEGSPPDQTDRAVTMAHEFWVPTTALRSEIARLGAASPLVLRPYPAEPSPFAAEIRAVTGTEGRLTFTASVDLSAGPSYHDTHGDAAVAIAAFTNAFSPTDDAALLVGVRGGRHLPWRVRALTDLAGTHPNVAVLDLDPAGVTGDHLAAAGDCHVALLGARGFAPASLAAMQAGAPVVALDSPAKPDVMSARNAYLVDPASAPEYPQWVVATADIMRRVAADPADRAARGRRAAEDLRRRDDRRSAERFVAERVRRAATLLGQLAGAART